MLPDVIHRMCRVVLSYFGLLAEMSDVYSCDSMNASKRRAQCNELYLSTAAVASLLTWMMTSAAGFNSLTSVMRCQVN